MRGGERKKSLPSYAEIGIARKEKDREPKKKRRRGGGESGGKG